MGNGIDWLDSCYAGMKTQNVYYTNLRIPLKSSNKCLNFLIRCWFSVRNKNKLVVKLPFRSIWYRFSVFRKYVNKNDHIKFVIYDHNRLSLDEKYIKWLRKKYPYSTISYIFTNTAKKSGAYDYGKLTVLNDMYDQVFAFDEADSREYGFEYNYLIYAPILPINNETMEYDAIFVGGAKERLPFLHKIYNKLISLNLRPCFYIFGVDEKDQLKNSNIHYNKRIPYEETMKLTAKSRCIIDILQDGSTGIALRICESVVWNKLIITDNKGAANEPFYDPNNILIIDNEEDITKSFFNHVPNVDNKYSELFTPERLFGLIKNP